MRKKRICIIASFFVLIFISGIIATNVKFHKYMKAEELSPDDWFESNGYAIKFNKYKVVDMDELQNDYITDEKQFETYKKVFEFDGKVVLVYATLKIIDKDKMNKDWWTDYILYSDNAWRNAISINLVSIIRDASPAKGNYINGNEYNLIFPYEISKVQVPDWNFDKAKDWNYSIIWSQNPIVYAKLKQK